MSRREYQPPQIGNQTPPEIFQQIHGSDFTFILKHDANGVVATRNIAVFADGACSNNGQSGARAGMGVYFGPGSPLNCHQTLDWGPPTSQRAEIHAAILALRRVQAYITSEELGPDTKPVVLVLDSKYVVDAMTSWITIWKSNGWRDRRRRPVANRIDFAELDRLIDNLETQRRVYVKLWHVGREYNEGADREARKAIVDDSVYALGVYDFDSESDSDYYY